MKKICIIYANCQNQLLAEYLLKSSFFYREYTIKRFPIHLSIQNKKTIPDALLQRTKLFIYQPVKEIHGNCSTKHILNRLPSDCQRISFPSLYFTGYYPQYCKNPANRIVKSVYPFGMMPYGDRNIISLLEEDKSITEIVEILSDPDFYSSEFLLANANSSLAELARREATLSIKVSEFIKAHYQQHYLFHSINHPTDILGIYVVNQIFKEIALPTLDEEMFQGNRAEGILSNKQIPIYPSVIKNLPLAFVSDNSVYRHNSFCTNKMTFARYVKEYVKLHLLSSEDSHQYYFNSIKHTEKQELKKAEESLEKAIAINPNYATYYREQAALYEQQGKLKLAEQAYRKAISISPDWAEFYILLGKLLVATDNKIAAVTLYRQGLKLEPENDEINWLLGNLMFEFGYLDVAEQHFKQAIASKPAQTIYYSCLGDVFEQKEQFNLALFTYRKGLDVYSKNAWIHIKIANILVKQNKIDEAIIACKKSITIEPENSYFYYELGNIYLHRGDIEPGLQNYERSIELNSNRTKIIFQTIRSLIKDVKVSGVNV